MVLLVQTYSIHNNVFLNQTEGKRIVEGWVSLMKVLSAWWENWMELKTRCIQREDNELMWKRQVFFLWYLTQYCMWVTWSNTGMRSHNQKENLENANWVPAKNVSLEWGRCHQGRTDKFCGNSKYNGALSSLLFFGEVQLIMCSWDSFSIVDSIFMILPMSASPDSIQHSPPYTSYRSKIDLCKVSQI